MSINISRKDLHMCAICGTLFLKQTDALNCEARGIRLPYCQEGYVITQNWYARPHLKDRYLMAVHAREGFCPDDLSFTFKINRVCLEKVGYEYGDCRPSHGGMVLELSGENNKGGGLFVYPQHTSTRIIMPDKGAITIVLTWREYFEELLKRNPSIASDPEFQKHRDGDVIAKILLDRANTEVNGKE